MLTSDLNLLNDGMIADVVADYRKLIGPDLYINSIHTPLVRLLLPILISADQDDREFNQALRPKYKPTSTSQVKLAIFDERFYEFLLYLLRPPSVRPLTYGTYNFKESHCGKLKLPRGRVLIFRANFSVKELLSIALYNFAIPRRAKIPNQITSGLHCYEEPLYSSDKCLLYARIIFSLTPTNLYDNLDKNFEKLAGQSFSYSKVYSNSAYIDNDIFKLICYLCRQSGGQIVFGQHGGGWNLNKIMNERDMVVDFATSVKYWTHNFSSNEDKLNNKINIKLRRYKPIREVATNAVFVEYAWPGHRVQLASIPQEAEVAAMYEENCNFLAATNVNLRVALYPNFDPERRRRYYSQYIGNRVSFKPAWEPLAEVIRRSNLIVTSVPNTVFYQAILSNYPVVIWFAPGVEVNHYFNRCFSELEDCKVFHRSAENCASFVNEVDVHKWWYSDKVQVTIKRVSVALLGR